MLQLNDLWFAHIIDDNAIIYRHKKTNRPLVISYDAGLYYIYSQAIQEDSVAFVRKGSWTETEEYAEAVSEFYLKHLPFVTEEDCVGVENRFLMAANVSLKSLTMDVTDGITTV